MTRRAATHLLAIACWTVPSLAFASDPAVASPVLGGMGVLTLVSAVALLVIALGLARVAEGSTMADNISYVVAACVCLAGSVLANWATRLDMQPDVASQVLMGEQALIVVAIALFCVYFYRVYAALKRFLTVTSGEDILARAHGAGEAGRPSSEKAGGPGDGADA
jgi:nitrate reductase gamma subunit